MGSRPADSPLHVLIIHRLDATEGYGAYLSRGGFRVSEANDSDDGVAKALALMPDFIVLDFDLDGETTPGSKRTSPRAEFL